ncbi:hypothetical protein [Gloeocapsopsis dulcis]|uniref:Uncharacterized protein n=1 Tax=Gloeocapsopsis dulcis AAB1 = 1H9 TaxID=1433147 RepID=A0A6N8FTF2_9CHRO|nr:hypothetical protein [Gloeocapsopsis dulcis]MUL36383.1 hypothetical protein [Gloeocapsopsis dulcis AAB1 = 1H9]WNN88122.1 hypothetical protein P0S91_17715 [Gloeocapsopsis dulcis]
MLKLIERILEWLRGGTLRLLILAGVILAIWGTLSPLGTLVWWLTQSETLGFKRQSPQLPSRNDSKATGNPANLNCYIVFLTGVGDFSTNELTEGEEVFLKGLAQTHQNCAVVKDVFPYSAANEDLGGERLLAPVWHFANEAEGWFGIADVLIKIRNLWRFAISADERYGPVYNQGIANAIVDQMNAANPLPPASRRQPLKIVLIGTSGGAQVALGATQYLDQWLMNTRIIVVSVGGVFGGINGFDQAERVFHLRGTQDWVEDIGGIIFPSRWVLTVTSPFSRARQQGRYRSVLSGPHEHDGSQGYFGRDQLPESNTTYVNLTLEAINQLPIWQRSENK